MTKFITLDSNSFKEVRNQMGKDKRFAKYMTLFFSERLSIVVVHEALRGGGGRLFERKDISADSGVLTPTKEDWFDAGCSIKAVKKVSTKEALRKATNDALIASVCSKNNVTLVTNNAVDFEDLKKHFKSLRYVTVAQLMQEYTMEKARGTI